jgi:hypothetical protein
MAAYTGGRTHERAKRLRGAARLLRLREAGLLLVKVGFIESVHTLKLENLSTGFRGSLCYWGPIKAAQ